MGRSKIIQPSCHAVSDRVAVAATVRLAIRTCSKEPNRVGHKEGHVRLCHVGAKGG